MQTSFAETLSKTSTALVNSVLRFQSVNFDQDIRTCFEDIQVSVLCNLFAKIFHFLFLTKRLYFSFLYVIDKITSLSQIYAICSPHLLD